MSHPLYVAFIWHQHQPLYKSRISGRYLLPWVRLHGTKDYLDLVLILSRYPKLHQTVNLVPSLILQIQDYVAGTALDPYLTAALTPEDSLTEQQRWFIIEHFFDAHQRTMIDPHARYAQLYHQRQTHGQAWCWEHWTPQDYSDLLAWHNLAWIDPLFWDEPEIATWFEKGRNFSLSDRQRIIAKQRQILSEIIPQHKKMQAAGQLEVTTTPYTHPILPLLADTNAGRVAVPQMALPQAPFQYPDDVQRHLSRAVHLYNQTFDCLPRGLWPSEQSVSPGILPTVAQHGFNWLCSDEAVLGWTKQHFFHRDELGNVIAPEILYQPYRLETDYGDLGIVFRDHRLSDLIGFTYSSMAPDVAARDLINHLDAIAARLKEHQASETTSLEQPWLVTIALDGENCWEFYPEDGLPFLDALYSRLNARQDLKLVTVSEYLSQFPPRETIPAPTLHSGSWIDGNFTTWIGEPIKNKAWNLLKAARDTLANHPEATEKNNPAAWEALYAAEGSDWFWWFGEGHSSNQDAMFDQLFREHLSALYQALGEPIPDILQHPLEQHTPTADYPPQGFIHPIIDGLGNEQDWNFAGRISVGGARGTMHRSSPVQRLWYGVDHLNFYLRFDLQAGQTLGTGDCQELHFLWFYPHQTMHNSPIPLVDLPNQAPLNYLFHHHVCLNLAHGKTIFQEAMPHFQWQPQAHSITHALDTCLEVAVPWQNLPNIHPDWQLQLVVLLANQGCYLEYFPEHHLIPLTVP